MFNWGQVETEVLRPAAVFAVDLYEDNDNHKNFFKCLASVNDNDIFAKINSRLREANRQLLVKS